MKDGNERRYCSMEKYNPKAERLEIKIYVPHQQK